ncbi:ATP-dependent DNA helicase pfh1 [Purpureocillium lavendulum]|uniref:ATP-dependent DNA helicase pfh1 n=1 Tax=Purpureocillium lavendulum TaxID=1247861 RepID=A0AB34FAY5_9HYPO|nr:ATP-dependent DNA helicase pfh1 [Purpureocillium lavendulum]
MGDLSHCPLSERDKELLKKFWTELENDRMEYCARCQETWFDMRLKDGICKRCIAKDKNKKEDEPWFFSAENQLDFGSIPAFLPQLTKVEEMLIAPVHVFVNVMQVRGQQYKYRGHIVHFLRDVGKVYRQLPLLPPELDVILLRPPNSGEHAHLDRQFRRQFRVRRGCLQQWLDFLSNNHPGYQDITVCQKRMSVLPEDGDVREMRQGDDETFAAFYPRFEAELNDAGSELWPEDTKIHYLQGALNEALKSRLVMLDDTDAYIDFARQCEKISSKMELLGQWKHKNRDDSRKHRSGPVASFDRGPL